MRFERPLRKTTSYGIQGVLALSVGWFVYKNVAGNLEDFGAIRSELDLSFVPIAIAACLIWSSYAALIFGWRLILKGWGESLSVRSATYIWCVSNLGRYIPGKIWSIAGMAILAQRQGVSGWAATGSAIAMQLLAMTTGTVFVLMFVPDGMNPVMLALTLCIAFGAISVLGVERFMEFFRRFFGNRFQLRPLPVPTILSGLAITGLAWLGYGAALIFIAKGTVPGAVLSFEFATGTFAAGYIVGLIALFAPGGLVVREGVLLGLLTPSLGVGPAMAITVASRLMFTFTELSVALAAIIFHPGSQGDIG